MQSKLCSQMLGKFPTTPLQKYLCSDSQLFWASFVTDTCFPCGFAILLHTPTIRTCSSGSHTTKLSTEEDQITFQTVHALKTPNADLNLPSHEISPPPACHLVDSLQCCHALCISSLELRHRFLLFWNKQGAVKGKENIAFYCKAGNQSIFSRDECCAKRWVWIGMQCNLQKLRIMRETSIPL